jgi:hypothetical protein
VSLQQPQTAPVKAGGHLRRITRETATRWAEMGSAAIRRDLLGFLGARARPKRAAAELRGELATKAKVSPIPPMT